MRSTKRFLMYAGTLLAFGFLAHPATAQQTSDLKYRRFAVMNGNQVRSVFGNWGVIGQPANQGRRGAWRNDNDGYLGDVSPFIGAEVRYFWPNPAGHTHQDTLFHSVLTCPVDRPTARRDEDPVSGIPWTLEPEPGYFNPGVQSVALSSNPSTWPPTGWADKMNDPQDPGWIGKWNGYFGKRSSADLESYFVMDDNNDKRFNVAKNNAPGIAFHPDSLQGAGRDGLGLVVSVRALQWAQFLAKDNIFWLYEIRNTGTTTYDRAVFGMLVGTYVGVTSTEDYHEYDDDWSFYDVSTNITYTGDYKRIIGTPMKNPRWVGQVGMVGYAFLESPGNPYDGIDNDGDASNSSIGSLTPVFDDAAFAKRVVRSSGDTLVIINQDYSRSLLFVPPGTDSIRVWTHGMEDSIWLHCSNAPLADTLVEGNVLTDRAGNQYINPNVYDGIDNNFNGLIDENYYLHYHQFKATRDKPPVVLIDVLRPLHHINYRTGQGSTPYSMIDERRDDQIDNDNDWSRDPQNGNLLYDNDGNLLDDVGRDGVQYTNDFGERDGTATSGYDNLGHDSGLPGEPHVDKTDVKESDQIGLTSFYYFTPAGQVILGDKDYLWRSLAPGYFDVPASIHNGVPTHGEDGDFIYGSGYFPLLAGKTERFSLALVYGGGRGGTWLDDLADLLRNKLTVQKIYDANYQFSTPPTKPHLTAVPGDRRVTLYWDRRSEVFVDPIQRTKTFEGYKLYRSTDPDFSDIFTITDASGSPQGYVPLKQWDLVDSIKGNFAATGELFDQSNGYVFYLGSETGLVHTFVDSIGLDNGRRYYYALVSYSRGDNSLKIFPAENTKSVFISPTGEVTADENVAVVVPNAPAAGIVHSSAAALTPVKSIATGNVAWGPVDEPKLMTHPYQVEFSDTQVDSLDFDGNVVRYSTDSTTWSRITTSYTVRDLSFYTEKFYSKDTVYVNASRRNLIPASVVITAPDGNVVPPANYILDPSRGGIRGKTPGSLPMSTSPYTVTYQYYPVFRSVYLQGTPYATENKDSDVFDGLRLLFQNDWNVVQDSASWVGTPTLTNGKPLQYKFGFAPTNLLTGRVIGYRRPSDYQIQFSSSIVDTSVAYPPLFQAVPVNFRVYNITDSTFVKFYFFYKGSPHPVPRQLEDVVFLDKGPDGRRVPSWFLEITDTLFNTYVPVDSTTLSIWISKPFRHGDVYSFTPVLPKVDAQKASLTLDNIRVVPNPYLAAASFELPLPPAITSGRERRIDFIHLPPSCTVKIFTSRGDHVITLVHEGNIEDGSVSWNLKSKENLDVAFGVYFYVVESPYGTKTGKIAIIK